MKSQKNVKSFFGGPLSTREKCKAAMGGSGDRAGTRRLTNERAESVSVTEEAARQRVLKRKTGSRLRKKPLSAAAGRTAKNRDIASQDGTCQTVKRKRESGTVRESVGRPVKQKIVPNQTKARAVSTASEKTTVKRKTANSKDYNQEKPKMDLESDSRVLSFFERMRVKQRGSRPNRQSRPRVPVKCRRVNDEMADFIVDGDDDRDMCWRKELRRTTKYDPSKFKDLGDDRNMESSLRQCWKEEQRSQCIGRLEDERELQRELKRKAIKHN